MRFIESVLNIKVNAFKRKELRHLPREVNLLNWLTNAWFEELQDLVRTSETEEEAKHYKLMMPCITPSLCGGKHTGLIAIDIDYKDNRNVKNWDNLIEEFARIKYVAYAGRSVSGKGYWLLIKISDPSKHRLHFLELEKRFKKINLQIDKSKKAINDLRFYSFDKQAYFNHTPKTFEGVYQEPPRDFVINNIDPANITYQYAELITDSRIDITSNYHDWTQVAFSFADSFGENGRSLFHMVSQYHPTYSYDETDKKFTHILKTTMGKHSIGTFLKLCKDHGIELRKQYV